MEEFQTDENLFDQVDSQDSEELTPVSEQPEVQEEDRSTDKTFVDTKEAPEETDLYNEDSSDSDAEEDGIESDPRHSTIDYLVNNGYISLEEGEDFNQYQGDDLDVFIEKKLDNSVDSRVKEVLSELPPILRELNQYAIAGGDIQQFFSQISQQNQFGIHEGMDLNDEANQEYIVRNALVAQEYPEDYINSQIEFLKSSNNLQSHASVYYNNFLKNKQIQMEQMRQQQEEQYKQQQQYIEEQRRNIHTYINERDTIGIIPLSQRDKKDLSSYMTTPSYKLEDGSTISSFQRDVYFELSKNLEAMFQIALLLKNKNEDGSLNFNFLEKQVKTNVAKEVRNNVRRQQRVTPTSSNNSYPTYSKKSLSDYFD